MKNFLKLQDELASTENQILTSRTRFNEAVKHTTRISKHSQIQYLQVCFKRKPYFEAAAGAEKTVEVNSLKLLTL
jgi:LemA protein